MRRAVLCLLAVLVLASPVVSRADSMNDSQKPKDYTEEDAQPLKLLSYVFAPIGFVLEWTVTRPLHWISSSTPLAPVLDSEYNYESTPAPIAELPPPDYLPSTDTPSKPAQLSEQNVAPQVPRSPASPPAEPPPASAPPVEPGGQSMIH
jgi:hypothetical protein